MTEKKLGRDLLRFARFDQQKMKFTVQMDLSEVKGPFFFCFSQ